MANVKYYFDDEFSRDDAEAAATATSDHLADTDDAHLASAIGSTATGDLTGTDVQANLTELDARLASLPFFSPDFFHDYVFLFDEFAGGTAVSGSIGSLGWTSTVSGTGAVSVPASDQGEPGYVSLTVSAVNDTAEISLDPYLFSGSPFFIFEALVRVSAVASASQDLMSKVGLIDGTLAPGNGAWFQASYNAGDTSWHAFSRNASGTAEDTDCVTTPTSATWQRLRIMCDGGGTYYFYLDGTLVATHTTVTAAGVLTPRFYNLKVAGATQRNFRLGYSYLLVAKSR